MARFYKVMKSKKALLTSENTSAAGSLLPIADSAPAAGLASSEGEASKDGDAQRKQTAKSIYEASKFADGQLLLGRMMRGRILMEGLREGMADRLSVGSKQWEKKDLSKVAKSMKAGNMSYRRQYPLTVAATMAHEQQLFRRLQHLGEAEAMWQQVLDQSRKLPFDAQILECLRGAGVQPSGTAAGYTDCRRFLCF